MELKEVGLKVKNQAKRGRPRKMSVELEDEICERLCHGESLVSILNSNAKFPNCSNFFKYLRSGSEEFRHKYSYAREAQADYWAEQIIAIADDDSKDLIKGSKGQLIPNHANIKRSKIRIDARQWFVSKLKPKVYGNKYLQVNSDKTNDGDYVVGKSYKELSNEELDARIEALSKEIFGEEYEKYKASFQKNSVLKI